MYSVEIGVVLFFATHFVPQTLIKACVRQDVLGKITLQMSIVLFKNFNYQCSENLAVSEKGTSQNFQNFSGDPVSIA